MKFKRKSLSVIVGALILSCAAVVTMGKADAYGGKSVSRIYGRTRVETSKEAIKHQKSDTLVIAPAYSFPDQISAMNLVNRFNAKFAVANGTDVGVADDRGIKKVYIISGDVENNTYMPAQVWREYQGRAKVVIIGGDNIYERNLKTLKIAGYKNVGVASSKTYADALSAYSLLREKKMGVMLVDGNSSYSSHGYNVKYTFGGTNTIKQNGGERIAGRNRYETSANIAKRTKMKNAALVSGNQYADAMLAINFVNGSNANILLAPNTFNPQISSIVKKANKIYAVGGPSALPERNIKLAIEG